MKNIVPVSLACFFLAAIGAFGAQDQEECPHTGAADDPTPLGTASLSLNSVPCGTGISISINPDGSVSVERDDKGATCPAFEILPTEFYAHVARPGHRAVSRGIVFAQKINYSCNDCDLFPFVTFYSCCEQDGAENHGPGKETWDQTACKGQVDLTSVGNF